MLPVTFSITKNGPFDPFFATLEKVSIEGDFDCIPLLEEEYIYLRHTKRLHGDSVFWDRCFNLFSIENEKIMADLETCHPDELPF